MDKPSKKTKPTVFGLNLRHFRKKNKISLMELGEISGKSHSVISEYERGKTHPPQSFIDFVAEHFGFEPSEFYYYDLTNKKSELLEEPKKNYAIDRKKELQRLSRQLEEVKIKFNEIDSENSNSLKKTINDLTEKIQITLQKIYLENSFLKQAVADKEKIIELMENKQPSSKK